MDSRILRLFAKSQEEPLSSAELLEVEAARVQNPWFALPWFLLAKSRLNSQVKTDLLTAASAHAPNRALLRNYLTGWEDFPAFVEESRAHEITPIVTETPVQEVVNDPVAPEEISVQAPITESLQGDNTPLPEVISIQEEILPLAEVPPAEQPIAEVPVAETPLIKEIPVVVQPVVSTPPVTPPAPGINWGLNTRISIRVMQFSKLSAKIRTQMNEMAARLAPPVEIAPAVQEATTDDPNSDHSLGENHPAITEIQDITTPAVSVPEIIEQPEPELVATPQVEEEIRVAEPEAVVEEIPAAEILPILPAEKEPEKVTIPEPEIHRPETLETPSIKEEKPVEQLPLKKAAEVPPVLAKSSVFDQETPSVFESEYKIGAFSGFAFAPEKEVIFQNEEAADGSLEEGSELVVDESGQNEIILNEEESGRIVEVTVSQELLEKYFKGRKPQSAAKKNQENPPPSAEKKAGSTMDFRVKAPAPEVVLERRKYVDTLVEKFIENEPSISPVKQQAGAVENLAKHSAEEDDNLVSETLARIYEKQGHPAKAIKIYQKLALLFPEKKDYFASLISKLKK